MDKEQAIQEIITCLFDILKNRKGLRQIWTKGSKQERHEFELQLSSELRVILEKRGQTYHIDKLVNTIVTKIVHLLSQFDFLSGSVSLFTQQIAPTFFFSVRKVLQYSSLSL